MATTPDAENQRYFEIAAANRRLAAEMFAGLTPEQWETPSLCEGWRVREVAAHFLAPLETSFSLGMVVSALVRYRGDLDRWSSDHTRKIAQRPTDEIVAGLRARADTPMKVPMVGAYGPMADTCIHLRDAARPLGLDVNPSPDAWRPTLDFLVSKLGRRGFVKRGRLDGLRLAATDQDWTSGSGAEVSGPSEAIALAVTGRPVALADLTGPGVEVLRGRLAR